VWAVVPTRVERAEALSLYTALKRPVAAGLFVYSGFERVFAPSETLTSWIRADPVNGALVVAFDEVAMGEWARSAFSGFANGQLEVTYDVVDGTPSPDVVIDSRLVCCDDSVVPLLKATALGERSGPLELPLRPVTAEETASAVAAQGVVEAIGEFTTNHQCCQGRVTNIHRIADFTTGVMIGPGESFSVNEFVGRRTRLNGFVDGGVIYQGRFESDVGGGVSQYATTLFNAAFFAGLDFESYQSHSLYLSRYPFGREATLSFPEPDLVIHNPTPYAVLVWPTYDATSITVTPYSTVTATATVTETGQREDTWRACTRVTTYRTRGYADGSVIDDAVYAFYLPSAGYSCDGIPEPGPRP
jgi:hypothetical protein